MTMIAIKPELLKQPLSGGKSREVPIGDRGLCEQPEQAQPRPALDLVPPDRPGFEKDDEASRGRTLEPDPVTKGQT
jgi:hypothetical protein